MGYDRIAFFPGNNDTTLISADKSSAEVVYGDKFQYYLQRLGYKTRTVVDRSAVDQNISMINKGRAQIEELPAITKAEVIPGYPVAHGVFVEAKPPIVGEAMKAVVSYLLTHCEPNDDGVVLDYTGDKVRTIAGF